MPETVMHLHCGNSGRTNSTIPGMRGPRVESFNELKASPFYQPLQGSFLDLKYLTHNASPWSTHSLSDSRWEAFTL